MVSRRQFFALGAVVILAACSDDSASSPATTGTDGTASPSLSTDAPAATAPATTAAATTTTVSIEELAYTYSEAGPQPVGVTTLALADGTAVEVWYPAVAGSTGTETYDVRDFVAQALKDLLTADVPATHSYAATRDADVADGLFPVVLFSHGAIGFRLQSTFLTAHLASWGMIVVAPDHPTRDLPHLLDRLDTTKPRPADTSVDGLLGSLDLILAEGNSTSSRFAGRVDAEHVAATGHSAGGGTALRAASDDRIDGYVSMASGALLGRGGDPSATTTSTTLPTLPAKPSFFIAGSADAVVPVDTVTKPSFELAPSPSLLWVIEGVGHNGFTDFCTFGNGSGIIGVADASGLGAFLDSAPGVRALGEDGCKPPAPPVETTYPIVTHSVTAWLRSLFAIDAEPVGLGPEVAGVYPVGVEIAVK